MESQPIKKGDVQDGQDEGTPVCIKCFQPVNPLANYCSNCGGATGNFTHYLPFVNIQWQASVWGQAWRQIWSPDVSVPGRLFRFIMIIWNAPIMLIGLFFKPAPSPEIDNEEESEHVDAPDLE